MSLQIAQTIKEQLFGTLGTPVVWSWGAHAWQALSEENCHDLGIERGIGGLKFKVNGHWHKGHVIVALNGVDSYDVYICNVVKGTMNVKDKIEGIYFDQFGEWIDEKVEKIPEYQY